MNAGDNGMWMTGRSGECNYGAVKIRLLNYIFSVTLVQVSHSAASLLHITLV